MPTGHLSQDKEAVSCRVASQKWTGNMDTQKVAKARVAITKVTNREQVAQLIKAVQVDIQPGQNLTMNRATLLMLRKRYKTKIAG